MMNKYSLAAAIHGAVNRDIKYCTDTSQYNTLEHWTLPKTGFGDCEDYALAKRTALLQAGWPKDKLGLCVCYTQSGEGHCVLWVDTDKGSFILDNNYAFPMKPSELPYKWESMLCDGVWQQLHGFV